MPPLFLYSFVVLIWGTMWIAIQSQLKEAPIAISVFYRFALAALILLIFCRVKRWSLRYPLGAFFCFFTRVVHFFCAFCFMLQCK